MLHRIFVNAFFIVSIFTCVSVYAAAKNESRSSDRRVSRDPFLSEHQDAIITIVTSGMYAKSVIITPKELLCSVICEFDETESESKKNQLQAQADSRILPGARRLKMIKEKYRSSFDTAPFEANKIFALLVFNKNKMCAEVTCQDDVTSATGYSCQKYAGTLVCLQATGLLLQRHHILLPSKEQSIETLQDQLISAGSGNDLTVIIDVQKWKELEPVSQAHSNSRCTIS